MNIFITGGTGFVGTHLVAKLHAQGHRLLVLTRKAKADPALARLPQDVATLQGDCGHAGAWQPQLAEFQPQACVHLAWEGIPRYDAETSIRNLRQGLEVLAAVASVGCPLVLAAGSGWEYGLHAGKKSEGMPPQPFNAFGAAKTALQSLGSELAKEQGRRFIWTRVFYVYGPGQRSESLIPYLIRCGREGKNPELKNPSARNDFIYIDDVVEAMSRLLAHPTAQGIYNIGSGHAAPIQEIVEHVMRAFGRPFEFGSRATPSATDAFSGSFADIEKLTAAVGWQPQTTLAEGVQKTIALTPSP